MQATKRASERSGFTLLELLVVVAVIGFLSSISIVALSVSQSNVRDRQRQVDQLSIIKAAELYTNDYGVVPAQLQPVSAASSPLASYEAPPGYSFSPLPARAETLGPGGPGGIDPGECTNPNPECCGPGPIDVEECFGGGGELCGNGVCGGSESNATCPQDCPASCGNSMCENGETYETCSQDCSACNGNLICEPQVGENIGNCTSDCYVGSDSGSGSQSGGGELCGNAVCDAGETPGSCSSDCTAYTMCTVNGEWDLCCLFGGSQCAESQPGSNLSGYYGVCDGERCVQRYLLQRPNYTCSTNTQCVPEGGAQSGGDIDNFVSQTNSNWLNGLERYLVKIPADPGGKKGSSAEETEILNKYWCSSHPAVVRNHRFCCWAAMEDLEKNINPYFDVTKTPTGASDNRWSLLCVQ